MKTFPLESQEYDGIQEVEPSGFVILCTTCGTMQALRKGALSAGAKENFAMLALVVIDGVKVWFEVFSKLCAR